MATHAKAKHGLVVPLTEPSQKRVPDLPAYVPTAVDVTGATPFGQTVSAMSWGDIELIPHGCAMSNITIVGQVTTVEADKDCVLVCVVVRMDGEEDEIFKVRCVGACPVGLKPAVTVLVCGALRLSPQFEQQSNKYYMHPYVAVAPPMGTISVVD